MSEFKGTKGPWFAQPDEDSGLGALFVGALDDRGIMAIDICRVTDDYDAQLIAAAPELLEALQQAVESMQDSGYCNNHLSVRSARAAINKALGKP